VTTGGSADPDGGSMHFHQYGDETTTTRHVWYTIYHHLPVVKRVPSNPPINQPTNGKRTSMDETTTRHGSMGDLQDPIHGGSLVLYFWPYELWGYSLKFRPKK